MSPLSPRCPLALLLALLATPGLQRCRHRAVTAGGSLCLEPELPRWEWTNIHWRGETGRNRRYLLGTATRAGDISYPRGPFHGRAEFQPGAAALCIAALRREDSGVYSAEFENSSGSFQDSPRCFRVSVWDPVPEPSLQSQILLRAPGWCLVSLLCSSPGPANVSISWECPENLPEPPNSTEPPNLEPPKPPGPPKSELTLRIPEDAEPQICVCNLSNGAGWSSAPAPLTCAGIAGNWRLWAALAAALFLLLLLALLGLGWRRRRRRRRKENSREDPPGAAEPPLTVYAEVGAGKERREPCPQPGPPEDSATIYAVVTPRTPEHPRSAEDPGNFTVYSTVQKPSSMKRKRLERALLSTVYLEDNGNYGHLGFPNPKRP